MLISLFADNNLKWWSAMESKDRQDWWKCTWDRLYHYCFI